MLHVTGISYISRSIIKPVPMSVQYAHQTSNFVYVFSNTSLCPLESNKEQAGKYDNPLSWTMYNFHTKFEVFSPWSNKKFIMFCLYKVKRINFFSKRFQDCLQAFGWQWWENHVKGQSCGKYTLHLVDF